MAFATFANPWHDEIGRFAPTGTGRQVGATTAEMSGLFTPVRPLVDALESNGATTYIVGGSVRDQMLGIDAKDIDIEVHDMSVEDTIALLAEQGARIDEVGKAFGVLKVTYNGETHDFSFPRTEIKTGEGHTGFDVTVDPNLGIEQALARRDFTVNAMAVDSQGNLVDPFGGAADLKAGVLRHVGPAFSEDPLRVLRGVQFAARFGFTFDPDTARLAHDLLPELEDISIERVWGEFEKLGGKGASMEAGAQALRDVGLDRRFGDIAFTNEPDLSGLSGDHRAAVALASIGVDPKAIGAPRTVTRHMADVYTALAFDGDPAASRTAARELKYGTFADAARIAGPNDNIDPRVLDGPLPGLVTGNDVMARGIRGPAVGDVLRAVQRAQDNETIATREEALAWLDRNATTSTRRRSEFVNPWHDEVGRFAPKGSGRRFEPRGDADAHAQEIAEQMATRAQLNDGFTFDPRGNLFIEPDASLPREQHRGAVAVPGHSAIITMEAFADPERGKKFIRDYLDQNAQTIADDPDIFIGGWHDKANGEVVLDLSQVRLLDDAIKLGIERGEQAIFDLDALEDVPTHGTGGRENVKIVDASAVSLVRWGHGSNRGPPPPERAGRDGSPLQLGRLGRQDRGREAGHRRRPVRGSRFANPWHDEVGQFAPKGTGTKDGGRSSKAEKAAAARLATDKAKNVPKPTDDDVIQGQVDALLAREGLVRAGGDRRGNNTARKARAKKLAEEFGDGTTCTCPDCGQRIAADAATAKKLGIDALTQDKILVGTLGGSYKLENLIPTCPPCNQSRGDREGVGVGGSVKQKWGSAERFTRTVVREQGEVIAQRFQTRRSEILKRKGISWEEHLAENPDALPQDFDDLRKPVGGSFAITERLDGGAVDGDTADHVLGVDDAVRVDIPRDEFTLDGSVIDGVVQVVGGGPSEALRSHHRAVNKIHVRNGSFANPWHDEVGQFAPKGTGRHFGDVVRNGRKPTKLETLFEDPPPAVVAAVDAFIQYVEYGYFDEDELDSEAQVAYDNIDTVIDTAIVESEGRLFPVPLSEGDHHLLKGALVQRASRDKFRSEALLAYAEEVGKTPAQAEKEIVGHLREVLDGKPVSTRVTDQILSEILNDGQFRAQFETGMSQGGSESLSDRATVEAEMFGLDPVATPPGERPLYGYMPLNPNDADVSSTLGQYGDVRVEFKPDVRDRTTFTVGDSLAGVARPSPLNDIDIGSVGHLSTDMEVAATLGPQFEIQGAGGLGSGYRGYVEAQIHGDLTVDDIARVVFPTRPYVGVIDQLDAAGIEWVAIDEAESLAAAGPPPDRADGTPLFTDAEGAVIYDDGHDDLLDRAMGHIVRGGRRYEPRTILALLAHGNWRPLITGDDEGLVASGSVIADFEDSYLDELTAAVEQSLGTIRQMVIARLRSRATILTPIVASGNPWHDEIGQFAPKGTGTKSGAVTDDFAEPPPGYIPEAQANWRIAYAYLVEHEMPEWWLGTEIMDADGLPKRKNEVSHNWEQPGLLEEMEAWKAEVGEEVADGTWMISRAADQARKHAIQVAISTNQIDLDAAKERWSFDAGAGGSSTGNEWKDLPPALYHATSALSAISDAGALKTRSEIGGRKNAAGLGGGSDDTISFTDDREVAEGIARSLHEVHRAVNMDNDELRTELQQRAGTWWPDVVDGFRSVHGVTDGTPTTAEDRYNLYRTFAAWRQQREGVLDPMFFNVDVDRLVAMDPAEIGVVSVAPAMPGARGYQVSALGEWRTPTGAATEITNVEQIRDHETFTVKARVAFANPWHDEIGRFAEKGTGVNFDKIAGRAAEAEAAGSGISELDVEQGATLTARLDEFALAMGFDFAADEGVKLTRFALNQRHGRGSMHGFAATDPDGVVLGAIAYTTNPDDPPGGAYTHHYHIEFVGSTGLIKGVGTQLVIPVMRQAAADGAKVTLKIAGTKSAGPFWEGLGFEHDWEHSTGAHMNPDDVQAWVENLDRAGDREPALVAAGAPDAWDPDDDRWAAHAIELGLMQPTGLVAAGPFDLSDFNVMTPEEWAAAFDVEAADIIGDVVVDSATGQALRPGLNVSDKLITDLIDRHIGRLQDLGPVVQQSLRDALALAVRNQLPLDDVIREIQATGPLGETAARAVARTELTAATNGGMLTGWKRDGFPFKSWVSLHDDRVRHAHLDAHGQIVPTEQEFEVGGYRAQYPGDPRLPIHLRINCRCYMDRIGEDGQTLNTRLVDSTRAQLYRLAQELQIPGRSKMRKEALFQAIDRHRNGFGNQALEEMTRAQLLIRARTAKIVGRSRMTKPELMVRLRPLATGRTRDRWLIDAGHGTREQVAAVRAQLVEDLAALKAPRGIVGAGAPPTAERIETIRRRVFRRYGGTDTGTALCVGCGARLHWSNTTRWEQMTLIRLNPKLSWSSHNAMPVCLADATKLAKFDAERLATTFTIDNSWTGIRSQFTIDSLWDPIIHLFAITRFANPWHDEAGKFAPKGTGTKYDSTAIKGKVKASTEAGVNVDRVGDAQVTLEKLDDWSKKMGSEFDADEGVGMMREALKDVEYGSKSLIANHKTGIAGIISYDYDQAAKIYTIHHLGSTGIAPGTGTRLAAQVMIQAASNGAGIEFEAANNGTAPEFWSSLGFDVSNPQQVVMSPSDVGAWMRDFTA